MLLPLPGIRGLLPTRTLECFAACIPCPAFISFQSSADSAAICSNDELVFHLYIL